MKKLFLFAILALALSCSKSTPPEVRRMGAVATPGQVGPFVVPPSWKQAAWFIDPANSSTCASDNNRTCSVATCAVSGDGPCLTFGSIAARWGTYSPRIQQNTTLTLLSSTTTDADVWYLGPYLLEQGASVLVQGVPSTVLTTTLSAVTAKSRASNQALVATFASCAGFAPGMMVTNNTHSSRAWLYSNISGCQWVMTQPGTLAVESPPSTEVCVFPFPKVDTWAASDSVTIASVPLANVSTMSANIQSQNGVTFANGLIFYNAGIRAPTVGNPHSIVTMGGGTQFIESYSALPLYVNMQPSSGAANQWNGAINSALAGGVVPSEGGVQTNSSNSPSSNELLDFQTCFSSGYLGTSTTFIVSPNNAELLGDIIVATGYHHQLGINNGAFGNVYLDGTSLNVTGVAYLNPQLELPTGTAIYGTGSLSESAGGHVFYPSGAGGAVAAFPASGGLLLNGQTKACLGVPTVASPTLTCNITVSPTNADSNLGATSGCLYVAGGASLCNLPF